MKRTVIFLLLLLCTQRVVTSQTRFEIISPRETTYNRDIRIDIKLTDAEVRQIKLPKIQGGRLVAGPMEFKTSIKENHGRKIVYKKETTYTFIINTRNSKEIMIGKAEVITTNNRKYTTPKRSIVVRNTRRKR